MRYIFNNFVRLFLLLSLLIMAKAGTASLSYVEAQLDGELEAAECMVQSPDGLHLYICVHNGIAVVSVNTATGDLSLVERFGLPTDSDDYWIDSLDISPSGKHVYATSRYAGTGIVVLSRNTFTGKLVLANNYLPGVDFPVEVKDDSITISDDGLFLYALGSTNGEIGTFSVDSATGDISYISLYQGWDDDPNVYSFSSSKISPKGDKYYVVASSAIVTFDRNPATGGLNYLSAYKGDPTVDMSFSIDDITISEDGKYIYVSDLLDSTIYLLTYDEASSQLVTIKTYINNVDGMQGLAGASSTAISVDGEYLYVANNTTDTLTVLKRDPNLGTLEFLNTYDEPVDIPQGLVGARKVLVSHNEDFVFVSSDLSDSISTFNRNKLTGDVAFAVLEAGLSNGLNVATAIALSADNRHLYVTSFFDNSVSLYEVIASGLRYVESYHNSYHNYGSGNSRGMSGAYDVKISPDGLNVYVASRNSDTITIFRRDMVTGKLSVVNAYEDNTFSTEPDSVEGLQYADSIVLSEDGKNVYVIGIGVVAFERSSLNGDLTFIQYYEDPGLGYAGPAGKAVISLDGNHLYVTSGSSLVSIRRDVNTGLLTQDRIYRDGIDGVTGLAQAYSIAISPDGYHIYVVGLGDSVIESAVAVFYRDTQTGGLILVDSITGSAAYLLIGTPRSVSVGTDGAFVYITNSQGQILVFARHRETGDITNVTRINQSALGAVYAAEESPDSLHVYAAADKGILVSARSENTPPIVNASSTQSSDTFTLHANATDDDGIITKFSWRQLDGVQVQLSGQNTSEASFISPVGAATLTFEVTVEDHQGATSTDTIMVQIDEAESTASSSSGGGGSVNIISVLVLAMLMVMMLRWDLIRKQLAHGRSNHQALRPGKRCSPPNMHK